MTFGDLQNLVVYWLDDLNFGYYTLPQVKVWINNAQKELQKKLIQAGQNYYVAPQVQTNLIVNQRCYQLPLDLKKINRLELVISGTAPNESVQPVTAITLNQQDLLSTGAGTPICYYLNKSSIILRPAPDTAYVMRLNYTYAVSDMTLDSQQADAPQDYHEYIALLAAQDGFIKDGRVNDLLLKKIGEYELMLKTDAQERQQDSPRMIVETGQTVSGSFFW